MRARGALQGDFNKNPTTGQVIVGGIISLIPLVDQACDVRDVIANCIALSDEKARRDSENRIALGLTCIGFVPEFGSAIKTVAKVAIKKGTELLPLLKHMEWVEHSFKALKVACPWGRAPREWLRKFDWQKAAQDAAAHARRAFDSAQQKAEAATKYAIGAVKAKLHQLAQLFKEIVDRIAGVLSEGAQRIKARVDEMLKKEQPARCTLRPYRPDTCTPNTGHHVVPDRVFRVGGRASGERIPGGPSEAEGLVICVDGRDLDRSREHGRIHRICDQQERLLGAAGSPPGTAREA